MKQILWQIGPVGIPAYGLFVALAYVIVMHLAENRARQIGFRKFLILDVTALAVFGGIVGAGVFHFAFSGGESGSLAHGGRSFFGGMVGALLAGGTLIVFRQLSLLKVLDVVLLYVPLGHAVGRIGCWFYGCCHGRVCGEDFTLAVEFPRLEDANRIVAGSPAFQRHLAAGLVSPDEHFSAPVYPTQILAAVLSIGVFCFLRVMADKQFAQSKPGMIVALYLISGGVIRFGEEFLREHKKYWGLLTNAQIVSLVMIVAGGLLLRAIWNRKPPKEQKARRVGSTEAFA